MFLQRKNTNYRENTMNEEFRWQERYASLVRAQRALISRNSGAPYKKLSSRQLKRLAQKLTKQQLQAEEALASYHRKQREDFKIPAGICAYIRKRRIIKNRTTWERLKTPIGLRKFLFGKLAYVTKAYDYCQVSYHKRHWNVLAKIADVSSKDPDWTVSEIDTQVFATLPRAIAAAENWLAEQGFLPPPIEDLHTIYNYDN
jgi:hypothetical protein